MDVGLNNRNKFTQESLKDVVFLVEATSFEYHSLWSKWAKDYFDPYALNQKIQTPKHTPMIFDPVVTQFLSNDLLAEIRTLQNIVKAVEKKNADIDKSQEYRVDWEQDSIGYFLKISDKITIDFTFANINGKRVAFYYAASNKVDYKKVEDYLIEHFQLTHDNYTRWNHVDAANFHNCVNSLDNLDVKPRNTKYKGK